MWIKVHLENEAKQRQVWILEHMFEIPEIGYNLKLHT